MDAHGRYVFDAKRIGDAHAHCKRAFSDALMDSDHAGEPGAVRRGERVESAESPFAWPPLTHQDAYQVIIVDNTNTTRWEYDGYLKEADAAGAAVRIVEVSLTSRSRHARRCV